MWFIYTIQFYSATKKNEIITFTGKWRELNIIMLSGITQTHKGKNCKFALICGIWGGRLGMT
jgi:hypothetical protein